jgi:2-polyprenyl-6-methoxyphenol hydroxylase-like FAD-dependent oxidoreductase
MENKVNERNVLIAGAGIAGPAFALLLSRIGYRCTIVERSAQFRTSGQQVDVSGEALKVIEMMGVREALWAKRVEDHGLRFVNEKGETIAEFPVATKASIVKELEILRPDMANAFFEKTKGMVDYVFDDYITVMHQHDSGITVTFANSNETKDFDLVVAADGLRSKTRQIAFDDSNTKIVELGQMTGFFDIPYEESDGMWSRWYNEPKGLCISLRPNKKNGTTSAYLCQVTSDAANIVALPGPEQRKEVNRRFSDAGWETQRILKYLNSERGEKFYLQESAQSKSASLASGRVALLGDAGYCPSPLTGQGTTLALIGAYMLAGCIATYSDHCEAFNEYEKRMKPFVESCQSLPPGVPWIVNPQTATGIDVLNNFLWVVGKTVNSRMGNFLGKIAEPIGKLFGEGPKLPDFPALKVGPDDKTE